jgi:adenosylhomocysteine nucleosidase
MIGFIFATRFEALPFLSLTRTRQISDKPFKVYATVNPPELPVIISGIGKVAAAVACQALIREHSADYVLNAGACGALRDSSILEIGSLVRITTAVEGDHTPLEKHPAPLVGAGCLAADLPAAVLVTSDKPVFDTLAREYFAESGDVVDMEGAAIARTAALYGVPWDMIKGVSDFAADIDHDHLHRNIVTVSKKIAGVLWDGIRSIC